MTINCNIFLSPFNNIHFGTALIITFQSTCLFAKAIHIGVTQPNNPIQRERAKKIALLAVAEIVIGSYCIVKVAKQINACAELRLEQLQSRDF